jgi:ankyrin repeat protein
MNYKELQHGIQTNLPIPNRAELWEAIKNDDFEKYTPKQIEQGMLEEEHGENLYYRAAREGLLNKIPQELLTKENLLQTKTTTQSCFHFAAENGHLHQIPKELLTAKTLLKSNNYGFTTLHLAASNRQLDQIPKEVLTKENLLQPDDNCLHLAAENGQLDQIPKEVLTEENLLKPDPDGWTCLHFAAKNGHLSQIPQEVLTKENLLQADHDGRTCLDCAARTNQLKNIPPLSYKLLKELKTHFKEDSSKYKEEILSVLQDQLRPYNLEKIKQSLKQNHQALS